MKHRKVKRHYEPEECLQYGTLAVVFPSDDPKWTLVLNKDCVVEAGGSRIEEGGTVTLCKVADGKNSSDHYALEKSIWNERMECQKE